MNAKCSHNLVLHYEDKPRFIESLENIDPSGIRLVYDLAINCDPIKTASSLARMLQSRSDSNSNAKANDSVLSKVLSLQKLLRTIDPDHLDFSKRVFVPHITSNSESSFDSFVSRLQGLTFNEIMGSRIWMPKWLNNYEKHQLIAYIFISLLFNRASFFQNDVTQSKHTAYPCETLRA